MVRAEVVYARSVRYEHKKLPEIVTRGVEVARVLDVCQVEPGHAPLLGKMMSLIPQLARQEGCNPYPQGGFRVVINTGDEGGQEVEGEAQLGQRGAFLDGIGVNGGMPGSR